MKKLTPEVIAEIRKIYSESDGEYGVIRDLSVSYGVARSTICRYLGRGESYTIDARFLRRLRQYGVSLDDVIDLFIAQNECCAVCRSEFVSIYSVNFDHDHSCCPYGPTPTNPACGKCLRGLTCHNCNIGLGNFRHSAEVLRNAAVYVERFKELP